jgi:hypothetical protein
LSIGIFLGFEYRPAVGPAERQWHKTCFTQNMLASHVCNRCSNPPTTLPSWTVLR